MPATVQPHLRCPNGTAVQISLLVLLDVSVDVLRDLLDKKIDHRHGVVMRFSLLQAVDSSVPVLNCK